jgi:hypothetical protein
VEESPNPYSPPAAQTDPDPDAELGGLQERQGARQLIALGAASATSNLAIVVALKRLQLPIGLRIVVTTLLLFLICRRRAWARWLLVVLLAWSLLLNASALLNLLSATPLWIALQGGWFALHLCMLVVLVAAPSIRVLYRPRALAPLLPEDDDDDDDNPSAEGVGADDHSASEGATSPHHPR